MKIFLSILFLLFFSFVPNTGYCEINENAINYLDEKSKNSEMNHIMLIDNKECSIEYKRNNDNNKLSCDNSSISLTTSNDSSSYIQYFNKDFFPITIFTIDNKSKDDLNLDVKFIYIQPNLYPASGKCKGVSKSGELSCNVENIENFSIKDMKFTTSGGNKYLIK